jgi:F-type H+-transporting ATPase subunit b
VQIDWSTILLEIINFLVLVWILKRFLYKPVLDIIAKRRAGIEATVAKAETTQHEAEALKQQYEGRVAEWEQERAVAREALQHELDTERQRRIEALQSELQAEREKARVADERRLDEVRRHSEQQAVTQGARFAGKLFSRLRGPDLDARLNSLLLEELASLPAERIAALQQRATANQNDAEVQSAQPLNDKTRQQIESALHTLFDRPVTCRYHEDPALIAGLRIKLGPWVLRANLQDELQGFSELSHESSAD